MAGIASCRERPPWARIVRLAHQGRRIPDLCIEFGVTRAELEREMRASRGPAPAPAKQEVLSPTPCKPDISQAVPKTPTPSARRRAPSNEKRPLCTDVEVRALLCDDRVSWNEAAWLLRSDINHLRQRAADEDWSAPVKVRRHAPAGEAEVIAKVKAGRLPAEVAAETLGVPVEVIARRVRRA